MLNWVNCFRILLHKWLILWQLMNSDSFVVATLSHVFAKWEHKPLTGTGQFDLDIYPIKHPHGREVFQPWLVVTGCHEFGIFPWIHWVYVTIPSLTNSIIRGVALAPPPTSSFSSGFSGERVDGSWSIQVFLDFAFLPMNRCRDVEVNFFQGPSRWDVQKQFHDGQEIKKNTRCSMRASSIEKLPSLW